MSGGDPHRRHPAKGLGPRSEALPEDQHVPAVGRAALLGQTALRPARRVAVVVDLVDVDGLLDVVVVFGGGRAALGAQSAADPQRPAAESAPDPRSARPAATPLPPAVAPPAAPAQSGLIRFRTAFEPLSNRNRSAALILAARLKFPIVITSFARVSLCVCVCVCVRVCWFPIYSVVT